MAKLLSIISPVILLIAYMAYNVIHFSEIFKEVTPKGDGDCKVIRGAVGVEDLVKYGEGGRFLLGASDNRGEIFELTENFGKKLAMSGNIVLIDTEAKLDEIKFVKLEIQDFPVDVVFHPHGLFLYKNKFLYVINHAYSKGGERVDVLEVVEQNNIPVFLKYLRSILLGPEYVGVMNDLVVIGDDDKFLITKYLPYADDPEQGRSNSIFDKLIQIMILGANVQLSNVYYCHKHDCSIVPSTSSLMNNGITFDGKDRIYLVQVMERRIRVLKLKENKSEYEFEFEKNIDVGFALDNIEYDHSNGKIYAGVIGKVSDHSKTVQHYIQYGNLSKFAGQWGGSLEIDTKNNDKIEVLTMTNERFYGISCSIRKDDLIFHGSWIDDGLLICKI